MKKIFISILCIVSVSFAMKVTAQDSTKRWSEEKAWDWYNKQPWLCGFNYIPAYAINYTAMWDKTSFDPVAIDKELALAEQSGMNVSPKLICYFWMLMFDRIVSCLDYRTRACCFMGSLCCMPSWPCNSLSWCEGSLASRSPFNGVPCLFMFAYVAWSRSPANT